jgi:hypothetical protein
MTDVTMNGAHIEPLSATSWRITTQSLAIVYSFDADKGLVLEQLGNISGTREVQYCAGPESIIPFKHNGNWRLDNADIGKGVYGGRPVVRLDVTLSTLNIKLIFHLVAFPGNAIIRQWYEVENTSFSRSVGLSIIPFRAVLKLDDYRDTYCCKWFTGGNSNYDQGLLHTEPLGKSGNLHLHSAQTYHYVPLILLSRENAPYDGLMVEMDYCGVWNFDLKYVSDKVELEFTIDDNKSLVLNPTETLELPVITLGVFNGDLDNLMKELYDWQYNYLWDYTNNDYYAKTRNIGNWVYNSRNLHEQFAYRLASFNLRGAQEAQAFGYDIFWDDAGWSAYPGWPPDNYSAVFHNNYDGPDFRLSQRFFKKCGLHWLIWFAGKPSIGLLESKEAAWGSYEWRTDAFDVRDINEEREIKHRIRTYLDGNPARSFHTCSGGSTYSHTFDIQRYANYNYLADGGAGPYLNYYYSYFETPDRWGDILLYLGDKLLRRDGGTSLPAPATGVMDNDPPKYSPEFARSRLGMVPMTGPSGGVSQADKEAVRRDVEIYHYLLKKGVAGRWSYLFHPTVYGDKEHYYMQRTSHDLKRAFILLLHRPGSKVTIFPKGLIGDCGYEVTYQNAPSEATRTGADLMENGIELARPSDGELIYLNLADHPGNGGVGTLPSAPGRVVCRVENNIGSTGVGIYWSLGNGSAWVSYYEVARDGAVVGQVGTGHYFFDYAKGWNIDCRYVVRAVDGDGKRSAWQSALVISSEAMQISALGGHYHEQGYNGWSAEMSADLTSFKPMTWIPPANNPAADFGGTPNQPGGIEGYWEAATGARIGRGWYQASQDVCCSRTHTVLKSGMVRVTGRALKEWYHQDKGCDVRVCILLNDRRVWPADDWALLKRGDLLGAQHDIALAVSEGDKLRFVVDKTGGELVDVVPWSEDANLIGWIPRITYEGNGAVAGTVAESSIRINCGGKADVTDIEGRLWQADTFFSGDNAVFTNRVDPDDELLATVRSGSDIEYRIPVTSGVYTLKLTFFEPKFVFNADRRLRLEVNGEVVASELDITEECKGAGKRLEKIYNGIVPDRDGLICIRLTGIKNEALIQAIEIAPELRDHLLINCGSDQPFIDWAGECWAPDYGCTGGECISAQAEPSQVTPTLYDRELYMTARSGMRVDYKLAVKPGIYAVHLKFAELWYTQPGKRPCDIYLNNRLVKAGWDPATAAGRRYMACDLRFEGIGSVDGCIVISIRAAGFNPVFVQAIEIE